MTLEKIQAKGFKKDYFSFYENAIILHEIKATDFTWPIFAQLEP